MLPLMGDASPAPLCALNSLRYQRAAGGSQPWVCGGWCLLSGETSPRLSSCPTRAIPSLCAQAAGNHSLAPAPGLVLG